ncbi:MAG: poly(R)-hydroxyalkanoic acid synthase subunit PhaE [Pseudomonadota bacterium]
MSGADDLFKMWADGAKAFQTAGQDMASAWAKAVQPPKTPMEEGLEAWSNFVKAWAPDWDPSSAAFGMRDSAATMNLFQQAFDPAAWMSQAPDQMRKIMEQFTSFPRFADMKMPGMDQAAWAEDMLAYQQASQDFGQVMQDAWLRAFNDFKSTYNEADWGEIDPSELTQSWLKMADSELLRTQASQAFLDAQKAMIQASSQLKKRQNEIANQWAKEVGLPTQEDVDDLARIVTELRREVRALKSELAGDKPKKKAKK